MDELDAVTTAERATYERGLGDGLRAALAVCQGRADSVKATPGTLFRIREQEATDCAGAILDTLQEQEAGKRGRGD